MDMKDLLEAQIQGGQTVGETIQSLTHRQILDILDHYLLHGDLDETVKLWRVLSALRGPDKEADSRYKDILTTRVRRLAFPQLADKSWSDYMRQGAFVGVAGEGATIPEDARYSHFFQHAAWALEELGEEVKYQRAEPTEP